MIKINKIIDIEMKKRVLITGITGYLGSWVCKYALEQEEYEVRGTVRDKAKTEPLRLEFGEEMWSRLEIVEADLMDEESIQQAVEGCDYVLHVASPVPLVMPENEEDVIGPAVKGTEAVFMACVKAKVKRLVITSSISTIENYEFEECDEETEVPLDAPWMDHYKKSKILADKKVWELQKQYKDDHNLEIVSILPSFVIGPVFLKTPFTSQTGISIIMSGKYPFLPLMYANCVDVRDVAQAHLKALKCKKNIKIAVTNGSYSLCEIGQILNKEFKQYGYKVTTTQMSHWMAKLFSIFSGEMRMSLGVWGKHNHFSYKGLLTKVEHKKAIEELGIEFTNIEQSLIDMGYSLVKQGYVVDKIKNSS